LLSHWLDALLALDWKKVEPAAFRRDADRPPDRRPLRATCQTAVRAAVLTRLAIDQRQCHLDQSGAASVVELDKADERRAFGESLPAGLRLLQGAGSARTVSTAATSEHPAS
jgi:hypothetical protein